MAITAITRDTDNVSIVRITTTSTLAQATTTGYILAQVDNIKAANNGAFTWLASDMCLVYASDGWVFANISSDFESLISMVFSTTVVGAPVTVGDFAVFDSTSGNIKDSGFLPSNAAKTRVVMAGSAVVANHIAKFVDTTGTIDDTAGTVINGGSIQAGSSAVAGGFISYPTSATNGTFQFYATNTGGAYNIGVTNGTVGQSIVYTIGDIGAATGGLVAATTAIRMKVVAAAAAAGGAAAQSFTDAFCTTGSVVTGHWVTQANAASILTIVAANGSFVVTSSADAGVGTFSYVISK